MCGFDAVALPSGHQISIFSLQIKTDELFKNSQHSLRALLHVILSKF